MSKLPPILTLLALTLPLLFIPGAEAITETRVREYSVFEGEDSGTGIKSFNFNATPFQFSGNINESQSNTYIKITTTYVCEPTGIVSCFVSFAFTGDVGLGTVGFYSHNNQVDSGQQDQFHSRYVITNVKANGGLGNPNIEYLQNNAWINVTIQDVNGNAVDEDVAIQVWQREVYTIEVDSNGNPITPQDHNVTIISGDTNVPEMRVYLWIIGLAFVMLLLTEWKKDVIYGLLSFGTWVFAATQFPSFLPEALRLIPIVLGLYVAANMYLQYKTTRSTSD